MRSLLLASVFLLGVGSAAKAADAVVEDVVVVDTAYNWSGVYVGAQIGYGWGDSDLTFGDGPAFSNPESDGVLGGAYLGYNAQLSNNVVVGVEGDFAFADLQGSGGVFESVGQSIEVDVNWTAAIRARLGYAVGRFLPYVAGGVAFADVEHEGFLSPGEGLGSDSQTYTGWTLGVGAEYAFTDALIVRAEYRYTDFGEEDYAARPFFDPHSMDLETNDVRFGVAYKF